MDKNTCCDKGFTFPVDTIPGNDDIGSKKLLETDNELHSSTIAVLGNDDLLIEILLRLPVLSLHLFKSVSKNWLSLITSPTFSLSRKQIPKIDPPAGLLILRPREMLQVGYNFESFDIRIPSKRSIDFVHILHSCNGLLLCGIQPDTIKPAELYVCNPTIKLFKRLPTNSPVKRFKIDPTETPDVYVKLAFDPTKSPHYKVIHVIVDDYGYDDDDHDTFLCDDSPQIAIYSSETGSWSLCDNSFPLQAFIEFDDAIYWNDAFHWLYTIYDESSQCTLKIVNEHLVLTGTDIPTMYEGKLLESGGSMLLLSRADTDSKRLSVYEMKDGCPKMLYIVDLDDIMMPFGFPYSWRIYRSVLAIVLGEREEDSYMIIDLIEKVVQYNPMLKTLRTLYDLESTKSSGTRTRSEAYQFIPSFAGV